MKTLCLAIWLALACISSAATLTPLERQAYEFAKSIPGARICEVAKTGSMVPTFDHTCLLVMEPTPYADLKPGDIVVFKKKGRPTAHRLVDFGASGWITKGDAMALKDRAPMTEREYLGRVSRIIKP